jgi:hypothetical protein
MNGVSGKLLNGWAISGIAQFQSGFPIQITSSDDNELMYSADFFFPGRPDLVVPNFETRNAHDSGCAIGTGPTSGTGAPCDPVQNQLFDPNQFAPQALGSLGNSPRSICCGPGVNNWDMALHKNTQLTEGTRLEFRAEFFNIFNHTQFALNNGIGNITNGSDFGRITRNRDPRLMQFALKYFF